MSAILIVTAVEAERAAVARGLTEAQRARTTVIAGGVGAASAAAATAIALASSDRTYSAVVSAGIGGAFPGAAEIGDLLVAERIIAADLGADGPEGFQSVEELGFGTAVYKALRLDLGTGRKPGPDCATDTDTGTGTDREPAAVVRGDLLTVTTATGTAERAAWLRERHPDAIGEAMEGYGVAVAAARFGLAAAEIRAVSNPIGPRDRSAWRIGDALAALTGAAARLVEGLSP